MPLPTSTRYLAVADADSYFSTSFQGNAWDALTTNEKTLALEEATRWLETLHWTGERCAGDQSLAWPRNNDATVSCPATDNTTLPSALVAATAELALALHQDPTALVNGTAPTTGPVKRQKLGDLEVEYFDSRGAGGTTVALPNPKAPLVLQRFPWLRDFLRCYLASTGSPVVGRVRS